NAVVPGAQRLPESCRVPPSSGILSGTRTRQICHGAMYFLLQSEMRKKLVLARDPDPLLHLIQIFGQRLAPRRSQSILRARYTPFEKLHARDVLRFFQFAGVHTEISVG